MTDNSAMTDSSAESPEPSDTPAAPPEDRAVVVTGGGTGIGRAVAHRFAEEGARVLVVGRTTATLQETAADNPRIRTLTADITAPDGPDTVVETALEHFGRLDILVNNAAIGIRGPLNALSPADIDAQLTTNLRAPLLLTRRALAPLEASSGTIVNIGTAGSVGTKACPDLSVYGATKAALDLLTRTWAVEFAPRGIRAVAVAPGVTDTGVPLRNGWTTEQYAAFLADARIRIPSARIGTPDEIAWWVTRLTDPLAGYANGTVLVVDGALSLR
ncbi:SDR family NAD(P)-dependent oxidoreductase [Streptomyces ipomoeae]|jgi:C-7 ketoreductase|uniref:Oxidoreductase, short chain dehydrogenase/reductase family protein n=2 Tax=Streptomyces ipomoeae TaxID=103232 RepID=L1L8V4_9ACTN|nr:SDR family oxidoreductase [Streptomyces ipomoeae]EKX69058.1 oxidoreductase, short chain dehydrogenase/reductase family protein [Streptomyces ipomoeae 91-03]MDX2693217.1 SDR family NAD(P)-dependent oxidoreductase [Streptomyces ipomoeae]MDX2820660.1 SDR family NAD(P)-dependent oxidoreductase [Streptomyces ipomoeae]MDX2838671.1 SDR family NAD(P)-dependent oxidoreductase [Streptomyces ipomoeae]MDX2873168.1 SDR family NAD(P)-dependent oxidoreductase [Streptomyces ipomoeae]